MISPKQLTEKFKNIELTDSNDIKIAEFLEERIDEELTSGYNYELNNNHTNFIPQDYKAKIYLNYFIDTLPDGNLNFVKAYILEKYTKAGWDITMNGSTTWIWDMKFNLSALREENINNLLEE